MEKDLQGRSPYQPKQSSMFDVDFFQFPEDSMFNDFDFFDFSQSSSEPPPKQTQPAPVPVIDSSPAVKPPLPKQYLGLSHNKSSVALSSMTGLKFGGSKVPGKFQGFSGYASSSNITKKLNSSRIPKFDDAITAAIQVPSKKDVVGSETCDANFLKICQDPDIKIRPNEYSFVPAAFWLPHQEITFGSSIVNFFQRKNHANARFLFKLLNALNLAEHNPKLAPFTGVCWLNNYVIRVDKRCFARLIGTKTIDNSLFHQQGNFPSHGFIEITAGDVQNVCPDVDLTGVDFDNVRLLMHQEKLFYRGCGETVINECKWSKVH